MLTIDTTDGTQLIWHIDDWQGGKNIEPWLKFYKWFFGRTGEIFIMSSSNGEEMFKRSNILRFKISITTYLVKN